MARDDEYYNKTRLEQEWCNGWNENELIEDLSPPWNQISPTVVLQSLGVHSGVRIRVVRIHCHRRRRYSDERRKGRCFEEGPNSF